MVTDYGAIRRIHLHSVRWRSTTEWEYRKMAALRTLWRQRRR